MLHTAQHTGV
ncbi:hypothetical protein F383_06115 [Gossypium arboreum]|uniref:Uncharacterized protein n=1 Tax=Gossypium arboreum TaxID=29729 RepID=A0A0B0P0V0_GOSAR|nr:hypothetical protein F383_06115 [Gossypium arboreum]